MPHEVIDVDQAHDDPRVWILTMDGIGSYDPAGSNVNYTTFAFESPETRFRAFTSDKKGGFWVVSDEGMYSFREGEGFLRIASADADSEFETLIVDREEPELLWVCDRVKGLMRYDSASDHWTTIEPIGELRKNRGAIFYSICQTADGTVWIGSRNAIHSHEPSTGAVETHVLAFANGLSWRSVTSLHPGKDEKSLWIGSFEGKGLIKLDTELKKFFHYDEQIRFQSTNMGINVADMMIDQSGVLWLATREDGILKTPLDSLTIEIADNTIAEDQIFVSGIRTVTNRDGLVYALSKRRLARIAFRGGNFRPDAKSYALKAEVLDVAALRNGSFLALLPEGVAVIDLSNDPVDWETVARLPEGHRIAQGTFAENLDSSGRSWFFGGSGLYYFDEGDNSVSHFHQLPQWGTGLLIQDETLWVSTKDHVSRVNLETLEVTGTKFAKGTGISGLEWDGGEHLYLATNHGLVRLSMEDSSYQKAPGLNAPVGDLCAGSNNDLWLLMSHQLRRFDLESQKIVGYAAQARIDTHFSVKNNIHKMEGSKILIKGWNSIAAVEESELLKISSEIPPRLFLSKYKVLPELADEKTPLRDGQLTLPPSAYGAEIQLGLLDFRFPDSNRFEYRIDDQPWKEAREGVIEIGDLENGSYTLSARATGSDGQPAANELTFTVQVLPYFWETVWFYLLLAGGILAIGGVTHFYRTRLILRSKQNLEKAHDALKTSEERFRKIFEESSDALIVTDADLNILTLNSSAFELLRTTKESLKVDPDFRRFDAGGVQLDQYVSQARSGEGVQDAPFQVKRENGKVAHTLFSVTGASGGSSNLKFQVRDVTQQAELEARLQQTQRMEAVGTLAGGIAHDFNNLLSPIVVHSQLASDDLRENGSDSIPKALKSLNTCRNAAERGADLVKKLLHFARKTDEGVETVELIEMTRNATQFLRSSIPSHVDVSFRAPESKAWIECSTRKFEQAIMNLGINAAAAIGIEGGAIRIEIEASEGDGIENPGLYVLRFSDNGCGMDCETSRRVFEPFFTTREVGEGTGLGLSMVHSFVEEAGGEISLFSEAGEGTTFTIQFPMCLAPVHEENARALSYQRAERPDAGKRSSRVMVVDDDRMVLKATSLILKKHGYEVTSFENPEEALVHFRSHSGEFDAVVTDQMMPKITGLVLAGLLGEIQPNIPILLLTGFANILLEEGASHDTVKEVHMKPLDYPALDRSLQNWIAESRQDENSVSLPS